MPTLLFALDVPSTGPRNGFSLRLSYADFSMAFGDKTVRFFPGSPPGANSDTPSMGVQHVFLEVAADETKPPIFLQAGYYLIEGLTPAAAETALRRAGIIT